MGRRTYRGGYQTLPEVETMTGGDVASQAMSSAAAGAAAGSVAGPWGTAIGAVVGGVTGTVSGMINKKETNAEAERVTETNEAITGASDRFGAQAEASRISYMADDGVNLTKNNIIEEATVEFEGGTDGGREIHGTPRIDDNGNVIGFEKKNIAPDVTHEEARGRNPANLIPVEGADTSGLPEEVANKAKIAMGDVIVPSQNLEDYEYTMKLIDEVNKGNTSAGKELKNIIDKIPTDTGGDEDDILMAGSKKKYRSGASSVGSLLNYTGTVNNLVRSTEEIDNVERRKLNGKDQNYTRDVADEERKIIENRNTANSRGRGSAKSAGQSNAYASNIQRNSDNATANLEARERSSKRQIEAMNINRKNAEDAQNLALDNNYDDTVRKQRAAKDLYRDTGMSEISQAAQVNERRRYQESRDEALDLRDQKMIDQKLFDTKNFKYNEDGTDPYTRTNRKGTKKYRK